MKQIAYILSVLLLVTGCALKKGPPPAEPSPSAPAQAQDGASEAAQVLVRFAELVSSGQVQEAAALLAPSLRGVYEYQNYAPLRNTPRMEILSLEEKTGHPRWRPDVGPREHQPAEARVFAVDVRYRVLGIIRSDLRDGEIHRHKATVAKYTPDGPWLISDLSAR